MKYAIAIFAAASLWAQPAAPPAAQPGRGGRGPQGPVVVSPEVTPDKKVTFRILEPNAQAVKLSGGDIPGNGQGGGAAMTKGDNGIWEMTPGAARPGRVSLQLQRRRRHRRSIRAILRSANRTTMSGAWSYVPGAEFMDTQGCAARRGRGGHLSLDGAEARSAACTSTRRRATRSAQGKYPVFYLLHGAGDSRRFVDLRRPRRFHPRQPDRGEEGQADDRRHAGRPHTASPCGGRGATRRRQRRDEFVAGFRRRHHAVRREALPRDRPTGRIAPSRASPWAAARR